MTDTRAFECRDCGLGYRVAAVAALAGAVPALCALCRGAPSPSMRLAVARPLEWDEPRARDPFELPPVEARGE